MRSRVASSLCAILGATTVALAQPAAGTSTSSTPPRFTPGVAHAAATSQKTPARVSFAEAILRAKTQAVASVVAGEEVRRAEALLGQARSGSLPLLTAQGTLTHLGYSSQSASQNQRVVTGTLSVPIFAPSRWASWAHASEQVDVSRDGHADIVRSTVLTTARSYLAILAQKRLVDVSLSAREIAKARYDFAHARRTGGIGNTVDEARAEQQLATAEAQLASSQVGLARAREALGIVTGSEGPLDAGDEPAFEGSLAPEAVAGTEAQRADVRLARSREAAARHVARDSWLDWLPVLTATGQAFYNHPNRPYTAQAQESGWQVQFVLTLPVFEGLLRVSQKSERDAIARESRAALDGTLRQARADVRIAFEAVARQEVALDATRKAADRARSVLDLTNKAYRAGARNDLDVSTAQQQSRDADLQAVIAEDAVRQARLDLLASLGQFP